MSKKLSFRSFDERGEVRIYYNGFLPHWRQQGCTYFVTFRLADSIPEGVLGQWRHERKLWLESRDIDMESTDWLTKLKGLPQKERQLFERHFVSKFFQELDKSHGECVLRKPELTQEIMNAVCFFEGQRLDVGDTVIMPNHVHTLLTPYDGFELETVLHSIKSFSSNQIQSIRGVRGKLWMEESHDHIVRDGEELVRIQEYIRANPEKANLSAGEYLQRSATYLLT